MNFEVANLYRKELLKNLSGMGFCVKYKKKSIVDFLNEPSSYIYLIKSGYVQQYFINNEGNEKILLLLKSGDIFGEITHFQNDNNQVITKTLVETEFEKIPVNLFDNYAKKHPEIYYYISLMISNKFRILMAQIQDSSFCNAEERLKNLLIRLAFQNGEKVCNGIKINHNFTHEELAGMISSTRSTVTRKIKSLEEKGIIEIKDNIIIKDNVYIHK